MVGKSPFCEMCLSCGIIRMTGCHFTKNSSRGKCHLKQSPSPISHLHPWWHCSSCITSYTRGYVNWGLCNFIFSLAYSKWEQLLFPSHDLVAQTAALMSTGTHKGMAQDGMKGWPKGKGRLAVLVMEVWHEWMWTPASPVCSWHGEQANLTNSRSIIQILRGQAQDLHAKAPSYRLTSC